MKPYPREVDIRRRRARMCDELCAPRRNERGGDQLGRALEAL
jgi:hypothetical protein